MFRTMQAFVPAPCLWRTESRKLQTRLPRRRRLVISRSDVRTWPSIVFITPDGFCENKSNALALVKSALSGGAEIVQLRDRRASDTDIIRITEWLLKEFEDPSKFSINGPVGVTLAKEYPGLGLHLRQVDTTTLLSPACELPASIVSSSVHSVESVRIAMKYGRPDFFQVGTMFTTRTHPSKKPEGPHLLCEIKDAVPNVCPLIAVGGIDEQNVPELIRLGADGIAVITAISNAANPQIATERLKSAVHAARIRTTDS